MNARLGLAATLTATTLLLAACGSGSATQAPGSQTAPQASDPPASSPAPSEVTGSGAPASAAAACDVTGTGGTAAEIKGFAFPSGLSVTAGEAVTWTNADSAPHTVTFEDGSCDSGSIGGGGGSVTVTYTAAGTYPVLCRIHPTMTGSIEVR